MIGALHKSSISEQIRFECFYNFYSSTEIAMTNVLLAFLSLGNYVPEAIKLLKIKPAVIFTLTRMIREKIQRLKVFKKA